MEKKEENITCHFPLTSKKVQASLQSIELLKLDSSGAEKNGMKN